MIRSFMPSLFAGLLLVSNFAGCSPANDDKKAAGSSATASDDLKKMDGTWTMVSGEADGAPLPEKDVKGSTLVIVGDAYTVTLSDQGVKKGTQHIDATKSPKQIDAQDTSGPTVGKNLGIYEFTASGDFRVCFGAPGKDRPTEFVTKPGTGHFMHVWHREAAK